MNKQDSYKKRLISGWDNRQAKWIRDVSICQKQEHVLKMKGICQRAQLKESHLPKAEKI